MKLLKKFRKKESGEDASAQAARELEAAVTAARPAGQAGSLVPPMPAASGENNGSTVAAGDEAEVGTGAGSPAVAELTDPPRAARARRTPASGATPGATKPAPRARATRQSGAPAARTAGKAVAPKAATKKAASKAGATASKKPRAAAPRARKSSAPSVGSAATRKPAAKKG